jgi:hypothetical protein
MTKKIIGYALLACVYSLYWWGLFFALEIYAAHGGFLRQGLCAMLIYVCVTGLLRLHRKWT